MYSKIARESTKKLLNLAKSDTLNYMNPGNLSALDPRIIVGRLIQSGLGLLGVVVVVIVMWAGYKWMVSGGKEEKVADARKTIINLIIGLAIMLSAYSIVNFIIDAVTEAQK